MAKKASSKIKTEFVFNAPDATSVKVAGSFTDWDKAPLDLKKLKTGIWKKSVSLEPGCYEYKFIVDGLWRDDPACTDKADDKHGGQNCIRIVG